MEAKVKEIEQQVREYIEVHPDTTVYEDEGFDLGEITASIDRASPQWVRPSTKRGEMEILTRAPPLAKKGYSLTMGLIQDSWLISAIGALLYTRPDLLNAIFVLSKPALGAYAVRLFVNGAWEVYGPIDDRILFGANSKFCPLLGSVALPPTAPKQELHVWLSVIEKAFSKAVGDGTYLSLNTPGVSVEALYTLTGVPVISELTKDIASNPARLDQTWERFFSTPKMGSVITFSRGGNENDPDGIPLGTLFALLGTGVAADGTRLCAVRSCLTNVAWKGRYAPNTPEFGSAPIELRGKVSEVPTAFIIPFEDLIAKFTTINYLDAPKQPGGNPPLRSFSARGEWTEETAGGCSTFDDTWPNNPQFGFSLLPGETRRVKAYVVLSQYESTLDRGKYNTIGAMVTRGLDNTTRREKLLKNDVFATTGPFTNKREVTCELTIEPGKHYIVVPSTFEPEKIDRFILRVLAPLPVELRELVHRSGKKPMNMSKETIPCSRCGAQCKTGEYFSSPQHPGQFFCKACMDSIRKPDRVCAFCKGEIPASLIAKEFQGQFYHTDCYRCGYCKRSLGKNPRMVDGKLCCENCGQVCCACGKMIEGCVVTVNDKKYHQDCVVCSVCKNVIAAGTPIYMLGDDLCCETCAQNYL